MAIVVMAALSAKFLLNMKIEFMAIMLIALYLCIENVVIILYLRGFRHIKPDDMKTIRINRNINIQISADLLALTVLVHFTGGIENPVYLFFIFHMVIGSLMLARRDVYLQASLAVALLWAMSLFEYYGTVPHFNLLRYPNDPDLYNDLHFVIKSLVIYTITLYIVVYMANFIVRMLRRQEMAYQHANSLLKRKDNVMDEYVARVTHNIKGHLSVIQTNLDVVSNKEMNVDPQKKAELTEVALARTRKLTLFVNDLLKLTQIRLSENAEITEFSLRELILSVIETVSKNAAEKSQHLIHHIDDNIDTIISNRFSIEELIINLALNAVKYTPEGGVVELNVTDHRDKVMIDISDTGIGIPEGEIPFIFNEFFRASNARQLISDGTGLGLPMARHIAHRYDGEIRVSSKEGIGTKFSVILPKKIVMVKERM
jgi:signal transduction histidine kinase